jgi:hypothetical protein
MQRLFHQEPGTGGKEGFLPSLVRRAQRHKFLQYTQKRDMTRIYANEPTRWTRYNPSLMEMLTKVKCTRLVGDLNEPCSVALDKIKSRLLISVSCCLM